jgi:hypothetical protein
MDVRVGRHMPQCAPIGESSQRKSLAARWDPVPYQRGKPWGQRRALRVFRDNINLAATPPLWPTIKRALVRSHYFIPFGIARIRRL